MVSESTPALPPMRLFVVDDDAGIRALLEVTISLDPRFELVGSAATGADCMQRLRDGGADARTAGVDLVLLDVSLPDADGIELVPQLRGLIGNARVALYTGWTDHESMQRARGSGADAVICKSGSPDRLLDELAALGA